ncbi:hypothetical protein [Ilumatobacter sp.]|uniref:hypothetical protein n=1 Tax=Ilumatobacter sp. TaxID=1967498 RepID=UPI003B52ABA6
MAARRYVHPRPGDDLASIAERELPGVEGAADQLLSWNLPLAARLGTKRSASVLPSDLVFVEPPLPPSSSAPT